MIFCTVKMGVHFQTNNLKEKENFINYAHTKLGIDGEVNKELLPHFYEIYANPLKNYLELNNKSI